MTVGGSATVTNGITSNYSTALTSSSSSSYAPQVTLYNSSANSTGPYFVFYKGRASATTSQSGDALGNIAAYGYDTTNAATLAGYWQFVQSAAASAGSVPTDVRYLNGAGSEMFRITSSGTVGINGVTSPLSALDVNGNVTVRSSNSYRWYGSSAGSDQKYWDSFSQNDSTNTLYFRAVNDAITSAYSWLSVTRSGYQPQNISFYTGTATERMRINSSGNVGIGTSSPGVALSTKGRISVFDSSVSEDLSYNGGLVVTRAAASGQYINLVRAGVTPWSIGTLYNNSTFGIGLGSSTDSSFSPSFGILTNGNVGIGPGASGSTVARLHVTGRTSTFTDYSIYSQNSSAAANLYVRDDGLPAFPQVPVTWITGSAANVYMDGSGNILQSVSSIRYKKDVIDYTRGVADAMKLRPVFYKGKTPPTATRNSRA